MQRSFRSAQREWVCVLAIVTVLPACHGNNGKVVGDASTMRADAAADGHPGDRTDSGGVITDAGTDMKEMRDAGPDGCSTAPATPDGGTQCAMPIPPGVVPSPTCDNPGSMGNECTPANPPCSINGPCHAHARCLALTDNSSRSVEALRFRELLVMAPSALATTTIEAMVDQAIQLPAGACGEGGDSGRNWLMAIDKAEQTVTFGGAPPSADPFGAGYCYSHLASNGIEVKPVTVHVSRRQDGTWQTDPMSQVNLPTFTGGDVTRPSILPMRHVQLLFSLTDDGNCIGTYNGDNGGVQSPTSQNVCMTSPTCVRWHTGGSLTGYITADDADGVILSASHKSLCILLTNNAAPAPDGIHCARGADGKIIARGNYCSQTGSPATCGCADSFWLAATFAASAAPLNDGAADPQCNGATDGGLSTPADAARPDAD